MSTKYSVIIVNYLADEYVKKLTKQLNKERAEIIIVDAKKRKLGYGAALNFGINQAKNEYVICMNPDISLQHDALEMLVKQLMQKQEYGMVGPQILGQKGTVQITCSRIPNPIQALFVWSALKKLWPQKFESWYRIDDFSHRHSCVVPAISGACFAVRKSDWLAIGGADEKLKLYFEEFDLALRMKKKAKVVYFCCEAKVVHYGQVSTSKVASVNTIFQKSRRYWMQKHYGFGSEIIANILTFGETI